MLDITTFLWFDRQAEEAANFYVSLFRNSRITEISYYGDDMPQPRGTVQVVSFELNGQKYAALNGGTYYQLTPAVSLLVRCDSQAEVDRYWEALGDGGQPLQCGWLTDKYGLSWQVVPAALLRMLQDADEARRSRVMAAMMPMVKLDLAALERAYAG
jgi:predicted 3-demethylubiquinone-9 3-methyltransferase (glyoxalase superfamily)